MNTKIPHIHAITTQNVKRKGGMGNGKGKKRERKGEGGRKWEGKGKRKGEKVT